MTELVFLRSILPKSRVYWDMLPDSMKQLRETTDRDEVASGE